jgi:predicted nucleic acid-binding protein
MKKTFNVDENLLKKARQECGARTDTETIHMGLQELVRRAAYERMIAYAGSEPNAQDVPRRRPEPPVWVHFFAGREPFKSEAIRLLRNRQAAAHELVHGEVLIGDTGVREEFLADYEQLPFVRTVPHGEVVGLVLVRRLNGRGVGWTDAHLLASALAAHMRLWTADSRLAAIADECGIGYRPTSP